MDVQMRELLIQSVSHYCDLVWVYDREIGQIRIHHDKLAAALVHRQYPVAQLCDILRQGYALSADRTLWNSCFNEAYLWNFFSCGRDSESFRVQLRMGQSETLHYEMRLERLDERYLLISGRNLYEESCYDVLTGVYNRNYYELNIKNSAISGGVALIDVDNFKLCNDTYGHDAGDAALQALAAVIQEVSGGRGRVIRFGGDEFLLLMADATEAAFEALLWQICRRMKEVRIPSCQALHLSVSIGGSMAGEELASMAVFRADQLMYRAKRRRDTVMTQRTAGKLPVSSETKPAGTQQVLIVDDSGLNRSLLAEMLQNELRILEAANGEECLTMLEQYGTGISLVLLDIVMPVLDGLETLAEMNRRGYLENIPVIMITVDDSDDNIRQAYALGVSDYISRPFDTRVVHRRVLNTINLYARQRRLIAMLNRRSHERERNFRMMTDILGRVVGFRNSESGSHTICIRQVTERLLERLLIKTDRYSLTWQDCEYITEASTLHDIGKIGIDEALLNKAGPLTPDEYHLMQTHTVIGESILRGLDIYRGEPLLEYAARICRWHHERIDGSGYPDQLSGDAIPIEAQVVGLADAYDALVSQRSYKAPYPAGQAVEMIRSGACGAFDPLLVQCLTEIRETLDAEVYNGQSEVDGTTVTE